MATWLKKWTPEDEKFCDETGSKIAWRTLVVTTICLIMSFATWFMMSAIVVELPKIGFNFSTKHLFWLAAMPGLAGGTLRIFHTFLVPIVGTRHIVTFATFIKILPCISIGLAVMNPETPFWFFMVLAFTGGFGAGDFSSYMPSTSVFFPKRLQGTALGIQAGIGNFGVSVAQFITPFVITFAIVGASQTANKIDPATKAVISSSTMWLQNASFIYVPILFVLGFTAWFTLRSVPLHASFREQLDIFRNKHTYFCTIIYVMTFGAFSGLAAAFPLLIKTLYGSFPDAPNALSYAFLGPLVGSASRVLFGFVADKTGGAILTLVTGVALIIGCVLLVGLGLLTPTSVEQFPMFVGIMLGMFFFTVVGNAATFRQFPIIFGDNPRQAAGVIGFTAAIAAYGPFIFAISIGTTLEMTGVVTPFFWALSVFFVIATGLNWWYYTRRGCEKPS